VILGTNWLLNDGHLEIVISRFNEDGIIDTTFNGTGSATTHFGTSSQNTERHVVGGAIGVQAYQKILAGVTIDSYDLGVARYNTDGTLDTTFGSVGYAVWKNPSGEKVHPTSIVEDASGSVIVGGYVENDETSVGATTCYDQNDHDFVVVKFDSAGVMQQHAIVSFGTCDQIKSLAVHTDGKIVAAGIAPKSATDYSLFGLAGFLPPTLLRLLRTGKVTFKHRI
jgi:uncharacterized delta-60 repeat protein